MGSEEAALLAAVLDDYDDDLPRLALADFWEENGQDERAEFVRVQCRIAQMEPQIKHYPPYNGHGEVVTVAPSLPAFRRREGELHWSPYLWAPAGPRWHDAPAWGFGWRRGFIRAAACTASQWLEHGDLLLAAHPIEEVTLTTWPTWEWEGAERLRASGGTGHVPYHPAVPQASRAYMAGHMENGLRTRWPRVRHWHLPSRIEPSRTHGAPWQVPLDWWQWG